MWFRKKEEVSPVIQAIRNRDKAQSKRVDKYCAAVLSIFKGCTGLKAERVGDEVRFAGLKITLIDRYDRSVPEAKAEYDCSLCSYYYYIVVESDLLPGGKEIIKDSVDFGNVIEKIFTKEIL